MRSRLPLEHGSTFTAVAGHAAIFTRFAQHDADARRDRLEAERRSRRRQGSGRGRRSPRRRGRWGAPNLPEPDAAGAKAEIGPNAATNHVTRIGQRQEHHVEGDHRQHQRTVEAERAVQIAHRSEAASESERLSPLTARWPPEDRSRKARRSGIATRRSRRSRGPVVLAQRQRFVEAVHPADEDRHPASRRARGRSVRRGRREESHLN